MTLGAPLLKRALQATLHTIANSNNYTAYEQAILGDNLHKHFF
jgi:hypothetical protein